MSRRKWIAGLICAAAVLGTLTILLYMKQPEYGYLPPMRKVMNAARSPAGQSQVYDRWGEFIQKSQADKRKQSAEGAGNQQPGGGGIRVTEAMRQLGREAFYRETFGNEVFLSDVLGIVDGPFQVKNVAKAIAALKGQGTTNLRVELAGDITVGDKTFKKGQLVDTGIDVAKGAFAPLGMPMKFSEGRVKVGISCAACHATVDAETKQVIEGAPNADLNQGLLLALSTNSAAYFTHTDVADMRSYMKGLARTVPASDGGLSPLPDPKAFEAAVDANFIKWAPGNFDSTIDIKSNPTQIPDSFTLGDHPYGWSGFAAAGPFKGLSALNNNVHAQNSDASAQADASRALFGIDKEVYLGTILQNAANPKYRYDPKSGKKPSEFFASVDPTPGEPGMNELIRTPSYPKVNLLAPDGVFVSSPGYKVAEQVNAMSAYQNILVAPPGRIQADDGVKKRGRAVFERANCVACHSGDAFTNNRIVRADVIGTEPSRAKAFMKSQGFFGRTAFYPLDTPVPVPKGTREVKVPTGHLDPEQIRLALAWDGSPGGYKTTGLLGLYWSAPYLHDGGVAVGPNPKSDLGLAGTVMKGIVPQPYNSLRAMVDRKLRQDVIAANRSSKALQDTHAQGIGHEFWVDEESGFTREEQDALIRYLLTLKSK